MVIGLLASQSAGAAVSQPPADTPPGGGAERAVQAKDLEIGSEVTIRGEVLGREPKREGLHDGESALQVATNEYGTVSVVYSSFRLCHNDVGAGVKTGERIEAFGKAVNKKRITVCLSPSYYIKRL